MSFFADRVERIEEYYFSRKLKEVREMEAGGNEIINLAIGSPDLAPPKEVIEALKIKADQESAHGYQSYQGIPEFREAIKKYYKRYFKVDLDANEQILPLMGSKEGIMHISMTFLNPRDEVLIPDPGYPTYSSVTRLLGAKPISYSLDTNRNGRPDLEELERKDLSKVKLMWINYPHMPTGSLGSQAIFEELIAFAKKHQILLVNDNPYAHIQTEKPLSLLSADGAESQCLELNSLSKSYNIPGWRLGMLCGQKELVQAVMKVRSNMDSGMFAGLQTGGIAALDLSDNWFKELNHEYSSRRKKIEELATLLGLTFYPHQAGLFLWCRIKEKKSSERFTEDLLNSKHIFLTPGSIFGANGEGYIRISLCSPNSQIHKAIERIKNESYQ